MRVSILMHYLAHGGMVRSYAIFLSMFLKNGGNQWMLREFAM